MSINYIPLFAESLVLGMSEKQIQELVTAESKRTRLLDGFLVL